mmetsp:Transcript_15492/g.29186  ORF Transcript_15492/g.29186 Transcript_15492/m.29186 type:complete len:559 (+) Transcript_15492:66-1742(+)
MFAFQLFSLVLCILALGRANAQEEEMEEVVEQVFQYDERTCRGTSLHPKSTWPSDHGDCSRSKYTLGAGLPTHVTNENIKRIDNVDVGNAQWIYTGGENAEFVFAIGPSTAVYIAKLDAKTLEVLQKVDYGRCLYLGGAAVHANGHLYLMHNNRLYRYWNGDLYNSTILNLPTEFDAPLTQTNGMLVSHDGQLIIKQWPVVMRDVIFLFHGRPALMYFLIAVATTIITIRMTRTPSSEKSVGGLTRRLISSAVFGGLASVVAMAVVLTVLGNGRIDYVRFFTNNYLKGEVGELKLVDPISLEVTAAITLPERCSFARMALTTSIVNEVDSLVLLGDEFVHQLQWNSVSRELKYLPEWSKRYRTEGDGTFPGTGPAIFNNVAYFTDNTFPVTLFGRSYSMFSQPLDEFNAPLTSVSLTPPDSPPGFMFWSTTVSPFVGDVVVWDIRGRSVQSRKASDLSLHWEVEAMNADCVTIAADKKHVYFSDRDAIPSDSINSFISWMKQAKDVSMYFIVADTETGQVLVNTTMSRQDGIHPSMIVPGAYNDVIIGTPVGLSRLYV